MLRCSPRAPPGTPSLGGRCPVGHPLSERTRGYHGRIDSRKRGATELAACSPPSLTHLRSPPPCNGHYVVARYNTLGGEVSGSHHGPGSSVIVRVRVAQDKSFGCLLPKAAPFRHTQPGPLMADRSLHYCVPRVRYLPTRSGVRGALRRRFQVPGVARPTGYTDSIEIVQ
jgi:hypothetical protein